MQDEESDDYTLYYHNLARLAHKSGRLDLVIATWQNALEIDPNDDLARVQLNHSLLDCAEIEVSIAEAQQALLGSPDDLKTRFCLAGSYRTLGYIAEAKAEWERIAAMERENWSKSALKMIRKYCWSVD